MQQVTNIAINGGGGRIGKLLPWCFFETKPEDSPLQIVAINDTRTPEEVVKIFKRDSIYDSFDGEVSLSSEGEKKFLVVNGYRIQIFSTPNISELPWGDLKVDIVVDCTGAFNTTEGASQHLDQGAKQVVISAPGKDDGFATVVMGVNDDILTGNETLISPASCTTGCLTQLMKALKDSGIIIESGIFNTIHTVTGGQSLTDTGSGRGRAAFMSLVPTSSGAAKTGKKILPEDQKSDGICLRYPGMVVSALDYTFITKNEVTPEEINAIFEEAAHDSPYIQYVKEEDLVSIDFKKNTHNVVFCAQYTRVEGKLVKILAFYDNEWYFVCRLLELLLLIHQKNN
jgi:glyceraldehyde 3-phosphate dehydrogenase